MEFYFYHKKNNLIAFVRLNFSHNDEYIRLEYEKEKRNFIIIQST